MSSFSHSSPHVGGSRLPSPLFESCPGASRVAPLLGQRVSVRQGFVSHSGCVSLGGCWELWALSGREATVCSVAGHTAERSGGESQTTHNSPTPE